MLYRIALIVTATAALGNTSAQNTARDEQLVGQWKGETYVGGVIGAVTINFFPNGTYSRKSVAVTEFGWTMDGTTLLLAPALSRTDTSISYGKASAIEIRFAGDSMIATAKGQSMKLKRVTYPVKESPLLGRWEGQTELNEEITQDFTADGRLLVSVTMSREAGRYQINDGAIAFQEQIPEPGRKRSKFKIENGKLTLYVAPQLPPLEFFRVVEETAMQPSKL